MHAIPALCAAIVGVLFTASAAAADVGTVILATGDSSALRGGRTVPLKRGATIEEKDILQTGAASFLQVRFSDSSIMALKEQSQIGVEEYRYSGKPDGQERVAFRLLKGAVRTITGVIGQAQTANYEMRTNVSTVGIRGSMYALGVCSGDCINADGSTAADGAYGSVLGPSFGTNKVVSVNQGGESVIDQGQHFHIPDITSLPVLLLAPPSFLNAQLPGKPSATTVATGTGTGGGAAADSRPNTLPQPITQVAATTTTTPVVGGPQTVASGGLPAGVNMMSMASSGFVGGALGGGSGIVRGQLVWTTTADLDLHLILPNSQTVNFITPSRTFNGATAMLDRDNTSGTTNPAIPAVENIIVNGSNVPAGNYTFFINNFRASGPTTAPLLRVTGDNNATSRSYNVAPIPGGANSPHHVVTRHPNGTATYSP